MGFRFGKLQCIRIWNEIFFTCQIFFWKKNASDSEFEIFEMSDLENVCIQKITLPSFTTCIRQLLRFSCFSFDHISEKNSYYTSDFEMKRIQRVKVWVKRKQRVRFRLESFTSCQILNWKFYKVSDFELKKNTTRQILNWKKLLVRFWNLKNAQSVRVWNKILLEVRCRIGKLQRIRCWKKFFTRQILHFVVKKNEPDFEFEMFRHLGFQKSLHTKIELLFLLHENDIFAIFVLFVE